MPVDGRPRRLRSTLARPELLFLPIALAFGITFSLITPPLWGIDEITHFNRVAQMAGGTVTEHRLPDGFYGGALPRSLMNLENRVWTDLEHNRRASQAAYARLEGRPVTRASIQAEFIGSATYSPVPYVAPALGVDLARLLGLDVGGMVKMARLASLVVYIGLVEAALVVLRDRSAKWIVFAVALIPMAVFQSSIVNIDSFATGTSLLLFAFLVAWFDRAEPVGAARLGAVAATGVALSLSKPNFIVLSLLPLFLPGRVLHATRAWLVRAGYLVVLFVPFAAWNVYAQHLAALGAREQINAAEYAKIHAGSQLVGVVTGPWHFLSAIFDTAKADNTINQFVGLLGWNYVQVPLYVSALVFVGLLVAVLKAPNSWEFELTALPWRLPLVLTGAAVATGLSIFLSFYVAYTPVHDPTVAGIQGRYFLPVAAPLLYGVARLARARLRITDRLTAVVLTSIVVVTLIVSTATYYAKTY